MIGATILGIFFVGFIGAFNVLAYAISGKDGLIGALIADFFIVGMVLYAMGI